jgi:hypothetical protein
MEGLVLNDAYAPAGEEELPAFAGLPFQPFDPTALLGKYCDFFSAESGHHEEAGDDFHMVDSKIKSKQN